MIPLYKPYMPNELPELDTILHSGALAYGKYGRDFEEKLGLFIGTRQIAVVNSFNSAVLVVLTTIGAKPGDEVIASPMSCLASNQPFVTQGLKIVWADIDPFTGTLSPESVKKCITSRTKAIFHNHFCGYPGYIDEINKLGKEYGVLVVDDGIEAFGSEYKGQPIGNVGTDATIFSFQAVRLPTTIDGGAVIFQDKELYEKSLMVRDSGIDRKYFRDEIGEINSLYDITVPGYGATMSELNSYIGIRQMNDINDLLVKQRRNAAWWTTWMPEHFPRYHMLNERKEILPNFWVFGILADDKRETIKRFREMGYYASGVHLNNNQYSVFGECIELSGVTDFYRRFVALPCGWWMESLNNDRII